MEGFKKFLASTLGRIVVTLVAAVIIFGVIIILAHTENEYAIFIVAIVCGYFGWITLNFITPNIFLIMPLGHWLAYYLIKGFLSIAIGMFAAPIQIGLMISRAIQNEASK